MWLSDEIVEISTLLDVKPSFQLPCLLATHIATEETFGILPLNATLADSVGIATLPPVRVTGVPYHHDIPVNTLFWLSAHPMDMYRYLQIHQCTLYPVLPVASLAEYARFKVMIKDPRFRKPRSNHPHHEAYKNIDFSALAKAWNTDVNTQDQNKLQSPFVL